MGSSQRGQTEGPGGGRRWEAAGSAVRWKLGQKLLGDGSERSKTVARLFQNWGWGLEAAGGEIGPLELGGGAL